MWATDRATLIGRALGAGVAALLLAGSVLGATATPPAVTDADIERARQQHRMPTEAELARVPVPAAPRIENLAQPVTRMPIDLEAISKGFDLQNGTQVAAMGPGKAGPKVLIFVSFAMPEPTLQRLVDQAARAGATLVLRGLVNGSIRETVTRMLALIGSRRVAVEISPEAFDRFAITQTPTFVLVFASAAKGGCQAQECLATKTYRKVSGDVSLDYAIALMRKPTPSPTKRRREG